MRQKGVYRARTIGKTHPHTSRLQLFRLFVACGRDWGTGHGGCRIIYAKIIITSHNPSGNYFVYEIKFS